MARTINLKQLNGDWIVNDASGTNRVWTKGIYSIVYSNNIFNTGSRGWIVKQTEGVEIFAFETTGDPWSSERKIIWNPNASGYSENSTAKLNVKTVENDYLVDGAGTNSYNGLYQYQSDSSFNDKNVYKNEDKYLFYSALLSKWVISNNLSDNGTFAYSGNLDETWYVQEEGASPAPSVIKYLPYMNVKSENIKTGVYVEDVEGQFTSDATATASHIVKGKTAYVKGKKVQGSIEESTPSTIDNEITIPAGIISEQQKITVGTKLQSRSYTPSNQEQVIISSNTYITGNQIIEGDVNLISENIKKGVSIFGVNGSLQQIENVQGSVQSTKLLFRLPYIGEDEYYHLFIEFSESNDFSNVEVFNTKDNMEMFKVFTGLGIVDLPTVYDEQQQQYVSAGINYIFSEKILCMDIRDIEYSYKNFRFHWSNDNCESFGEYDYGNVNANMSALGQVNQKVDFYKCASVDTDNKTWTGYKAVLNDGVYSFAETLTEGLRYGTGYKPIELNVYNVDATINVNIYEGHNIVEGGLIRYATLSKFASNDILGNSLDVNGKSVFSVVDGVSSVFISGNNNYIGYSTPLTLNSFTLSVWMKAVGTALVTFSNGYYGSDSGEMWIMLNSDTLSIANGSQYGGTIAELPADSGWHHCAVSWSGDKFILYLDGTKVESDPCSYYFEDAYLYAGSLQRAFDHVGGDGYYAALRMYDRVLEDNEIYQLANEFKPTI